MNTLQYITAITTAVNFYNYIITQFSITSSDWHFHSVAYYVDFTRQMAKPMGIQHTNYCIGRIWIVTITNYVRNLQVVYFIWCFNLTAFLLQLYYSS